MTSVDNSCDYGCDETSFNIGCPTHSPYHDQTRDIPSGIRRMNKRDQILDTARKLINGDRKHTYGDAREDFARTGKLWEQVLGVPVSPWKVAICLAMVKVSRLVASSGAHEDSWVDGCGYLALGGEIGIPEGPL